MLRSNGIIICRSSSESVPGNRNIPEVHPPHTSTTIFGYFRPESFATETNEESFAISLTITVVDRKSFFFVLCSWVAIKRFPRVNVFQWARDGSHYISTFSGGVEYRSKRRKTNFSCYYARELFTGDSYTDSSLNRIVFCTSSSRHPPTRDKKQWRNKKTVNNLGIPERTREHGRFISEDKTRPDSSR